MCAAEHRQSALRQGLSLKTEGAERVFPATKAPAPGPGSEKR